jgi:hypothetical protein
VPYVIKAKDKTVFRAPLLHLHVSSYTHAKSAFYTIDWNHKKACLGLYIDRERNLHIVITMNGMVKSDMLDNNAMPYAKLGFYGTVHSQGHFPVDINMQTNRNIDMYACFWYCDRYSKKVNELIILNSARRGYIY